MLLTMLVTIFPKAPPMITPTAMSTTLPFSVGAFLAAAGEATYLGADIAHNVEHIRHPHYAPDVYHEVHGTGRIYVKPGVDSPQDIASRAFEAGLNQGIHGPGIGR